jgi:hypothetical protein
MTSLGRIEASPEAAGIDQGRWIALIGSHRSLAPVPPRQGINPFTREQTEFRAPATSAIVSIEGTVVGSICWAMDGSPMLVVDARDESAEAVTSVADEVAIALGARFVRATNQG